MLLHLLLWTALAWLATTIFLRAVRAGGREGFVFDENHLSRAARLLFSGAALLFAAALAVNWFTPAIRGWVTPNHLSAGWMLATGHPLYHGVESPHIYSLAYGPTPFIFNALFFKLLGPNLFAARTGGLLFVLAAPVFTALALKKELSARWAFLGAAAFVAVVATYKNYFFPPINNVFLLGAVSLALYAATMERPLAAILLCGLGMAIAVDCKGHSPLYLLPIAIVLMQRHGLGRAVAAIVWGVFLTFLPFFVSDNLSLPNYLMWLIKAAGQGWSWPLFARVVQWWAFLLLVPPAAAGFAAGNFKAVTKALREDPVRWPLLALAACMTLMIGFASKTGSGPHHFVPFVPVIVFLTAQLAKAARAEIENSPKSVALSALAAAMILSLGTVATVRAATLLDDEIRAWPEGRAVTTDVQNFLKTHPAAQVQIGYGEGLPEKNPQSWYGPLVVFAGAPLIADGVALMDNSRTGHKTPQAMIDLIAGCTPRSWLIPKGDEPFRMLNTYEPDQEVFSAEFRQTFHETYEKCSETEFFDEWCCKKREP